MADLLGRRRIFLAAPSSSLWPRPRRPGEGAPGFLIVFLAVEGCGAVIIWPVVLLIVATTTFEEGEDRNKGSR